METGKERVDAGSSTGARPSRQMGKERTLRVIAARRGYRLERCLRADPQAIGYGGYMLFDAMRNFVVCGDSPHAYSATLTDIEAFIDPAEDAASVGAVFG